MSLAVLPARVDRLEDLMIEQASNINRITDRIERLTERMDRLTERVDRLTERVDRLTERVDRTSEDVSRLSTEMREFKDEMKEQRKRQDEENRRFRQELANISRSHGRMIEDIIAPSVPGVLAQVVGCTEPPQMEGIRIRKNCEGETREYDALAVCGDYLLIVEARSQFHTADVREFVDELREARVFLHEYADRKLIGAMASFYVNMSLVTHGERQGLIMLGVVDGLLQVLNREGFSPTTF